MSAIDDLVAATKMNVAKIELICSTIKETIEEKP